MNVISPPHPTPCSDVAIETGRTSPRTRHSRQINMKTLRPTQDHMVKFTTVRSPERRRHLVFGFMLTVAVDGCCFSMFGLIAVLVYSNGLEWEDHEPCNLRNKARHSHSTEVLHFSSFLWCLCVIDPMENPHLILQPKLRLKHFEASNT